MLTFILEAAIRSFLMAVVVWGCIQLLRVQAVLAQKVAWVLVLVAAGAMPLVMRLPFLATFLAPQRAVQIPLRSLPQWLGAPPQAQTLSAGTPAAPMQQVQIAHLPKPSAAHLLDRTNEVLASVEPAIAEAESVLRGESESALKAASGVAPAPTPASAIRRPAANAKAASPGRPAFWNWTTIKSLVFSLYFLVAGLLLLRTLAGLAIARRLWRRAKPVILPAETVSDAPTKSIRISPDLKTPVTIGSTILLPADYAGWEPAKLRVVLAHEHSHVRQGDFYLQLLAAIHATVFWFSPLGWWLQRKLSELGEALSDRAGLEQAADPPYYAQILLEFAAIPRKTSFFTPVAGVAMARSSRLSSRIERILNGRHFRLAFLGGRRHAVLTAVLVPFALVAAVALIRIAPAVEASQSPQAAPAPTTAPIPATDPMAAAIVGQSAPPAPPAPTAPTVEPPPPPTPPDPDEAGQDLVRDSGMVSDDSDDAFAIVHENGGKTIHMNGSDNDQLKKARQKVRGNFIWFERDGKSYVITDPAVVAQSEALFKGNEPLQRQQEALQKLQAKLDKEMQDLSPEIAKASLPGPEFAEQMAKLNAELAELQSDKYKKLSEEIAKAVQNNKALSSDAIQELTQEKLGELQERIGEIQGHIGEIQGKIGERQGLLGEKQGEIGERMGKLGEEMGKIGEEQGRIAEEASRKMQSVIDQAIKEGKARPLE